jgi:hypothetical protein
LQELKGQAEALSALQQGAMFSDQQSQKVMEQLKKEFAEVRDISYARKFF